MTILGLLAMEKWLLVRTGQEAGLRRNSDSLQRLQSKSKYQGAVTASYNGNDRFVIPDR